MSRQCAFKGILQHLGFRALSELGAGLLLGLLPVHATGFEKADLAATVEAFVSAKAIAEYPAARDVIIKVQAPDNRMQITGCDPESLGLHNGTTISRRVLVKINCDQPLNLYLPVDIEVYVDVVVAAMPIARSSQLRAPQVKLEAMDALKSGRAHYDKIKDVVGLEAKRAIRQGSLLTTAMLTAPDLVNRGDRVIILAETGSLEVKMQGEALGAGTLGEEIRVKNLSSERVIRARVTGEGQVSVRF